LGNTVKRLKCRSEHRKHETKVSISEERNMLTSFLPRKEWSAVLINNENSSDEVES